MSTNGGMAGDEGEVYEGDDGGGLETGQEQGGQDQQEESASPWSEGLDDELRSYVESKGWKDIGAAIRSGREAETGFHQQRQAAEQYERLLAQYAQQGGQQQQGYSSQPMNDPWQAFNQQVTNISRAVEEGTVDTGEAFGFMLSQQRELMNAEFEARLEAQQQQLVEQNINPLFNHQWETHWISEAQKMRSEFGDDFDAIKGDAAKILTAQINQDENFRFNPDAMKLSFAEAFRRHELSARRARSAQTAQNGARGPGGRSVDPTKAILDGMDAVAPPGMNGGLV